MKSKLRRLFSAYLLMLSGAFSILVPPAAAFTSPENVMGIDEIVPGMKGYGKTVFKADRIELFDVEVLGTLRKWDAGGDMVLIRMAGGPLEKSGIIAGMSGSPVYINNRLIGAVAYGWSFSKEAIAGVTPIGEMTHTLLNLPVRGNDAPLAGLDGDWQFPFPDDLTANAQPGELLFSKNPETGAGEWPFAPPLIPQETVSPDSNASRLTPILSPLVISGVDSGTLQRMQPFFRAFGLSPLQGGNCVPPAYLPSERPKLVPGSAVAAILIQGDLSAAVVGTVTYVEGENVLAFGHPFLQTGSADIPMATAYVYAVLTSQSQSIKMASPVETIGRICQDRRAGIAGTFGNAPRMVPCRVEIDGSQKSRYNFEIVNNKLLTPSLVLMAAQSAVLSTERKLGEKSIAIRLSAHIDGQEKPVTIENVFYELDQSWFSLNHIVQPLAMVMNNQFQRVQLNGIDLAIKVLDTRKTAYIEAIRVNKKQVKPGESLQVSVVIKPYTGESFIQTVTVPIPEDALPGSTLNVAACDATYSQALNMGRSAGKHLPTNFGQLLHYVENMERNNNLVVRVLLPKRGLTYKGEGFPSLPASVMSIMSFSNQSGIGPLLDEVITRAPTAYVLNGNQIISVLVE